MESAALNIGVLTLPNIFLGLAKDDKEQRSMWEQAGACRGAVEQAVAATPSCTCTPELYLPSTTPPPATDEHAPSPVSSQQLLVITPLLVNNRLLIKFIVLLQRAPHVPLHCDTFSRR